MVSQQNRLRKGTFLSVNTPLFNRVARKLRLLSETNTEKSTSQVKDLFGLHHLEGIDICNPLDVFRGFNVLGRSAYGSGESQRILGLQLNRKAIFSA